MDSSNNKSKKGLYFIFAIIILCLVAAGLVLMTKDNDQDSEIDSEQTAITSTKTTLDTLCQITLPRLIQCQNLENDQLTTYRLPEKMGNASRVSPSPDQSQFIIELHDSSILVDKDFNKIADLPHGEVDQSWWTDLMWLDSDTIVYSASVQNAEGTSESSLNSQIYSYDIVSKQATQLTSYQESLTYAYPSQDNTMIFSRIQRPEQSETIAVIGTDGTVEEVKSILSTDRTELSGTIDYDRNSDLFYLTQTESRSSIPLKLDKDPEGNYQLKQTSNQVLEQAYQGPSIEQGVVVLAPNSDQDLSAHYQLINNQNSIQDLQLTKASSQGYSYGLPFAISQNLNLETIDNGAIGATDYLYSYVDLPTKLGSYMLDLVKQNCSEGNYNIVIVDNQIDDNQAIARFNGCNGLSYIGYYKLNGTNFEEVIRTQNGLSCTNLKENGFDPELIDTCTE